MKDPLWVSGTCDRIKAVLKFWYSTYDAGKVSATRQRLTKPGELGPQPILVDDVTRRSCKIPWNYYDLEYLVKILEARCSNDPKDKFSTFLSQIAVDLRINLPKWKNGDLWFQSITIPINLNLPTTPGNLQSVTLPNPVRAVEIDCYKEGVLGMLILLGAMESGKTIEQRKDLSSIDLSQFSK